MENKICTSIEQSKKLVELGIDINTADFHYCCGDNTDLDIGYPIFWDDIPAWSLSALLKLLPSPSLNSTFSGWRCDSYNEERTSCLLGDPSDNPVDACYEMILKLREQKLL